MGVRTRENIILCPLAHPKRRWSPHFCCNPHCFRVKIPHSHLSSPSLSTQFLPLSLTLFFLPPPTHGTVIEAVGDGGVCGVEGSEHHARPEDQLGYAANSSRQSEVHKRRRSPRSRWSSVGLVVALGVEVVADAARRARPPRNLQRRALLLEVEWVTEVKPFHSQDRCPSQRGRDQ